MAKARGRAPLPRVSSFFYAENSSDAAEKKFKTNFNTIIAVFKNVRMMRDNEAANLAKYLLRSFDLGDAETAVYVTGEGYDYTLEVHIGEAILEVIRGREEVKLAA